MEPAAGAADPDGDGVAEVVVADAVVDGTSGVTVVLELGTSVEVVEVASVEEGAGVVSVVVGVLGAAVTVVVAGVVDVLVVVVVFHQSQSASRTQSSCCASNWFWCQKNLPHFFSTAAPSVHWM